MAGERAVFKGIWILKGIGFLGNEHIIRSFTVIDLLVLKL